MDDWWPDELAYAGQEHLDPAYVAGYDRKAGYDPEPDVEALRAHGLGPGCRVVDLGAGTGTFALAAARAGASVTAVDVSPAMVEVLRRGAADAGLDHLDVVHAGFLSYEHTGSPPDIVFTRNALHQLPDFWKGIALARVAGMMPPGSILRVRDLVFDFEPAEAQDAIPAWMAGAVDDPARGWTASELAEHVRIEFSTYRWLFEAMLARTGFEILDVEYVRRAYGAYTCRRRQDPVR